MAGEIVKGSWVEALTKGTSDAIRGAGRAVNSSVVGPYVRSSGSTVVKVGEGIAVGALLSAAKARFGVDASPAAMAAAALAAIATAGSMPAVSDHASNVAGQAAAIMAYLRAGQFLTGWSAPKTVAGPAATKTVGPAPSTPHGETMGGDPVLAAGQRIAQRYAAED